MAPDEAVQLSDTCVLPGVALTPVGTAGTTPGGGGPPGLGGVSFRAPGCGGETPRRGPAAGGFGPVLPWVGAEGPCGDRRYLPLFEAAAECGVPVAIHTGGEGMGIAASPGGAGPGSFYIEWHTLGSAGSQMAHLVSPLCPGPVERLRSNFVAGIKHMPVRFRPRRTSAGTAASA